MLNREVMYEMWTPAIVSFVVIIISAILLSILEKKQIIKQKSKAFRTVEIMGVCIPTAVICVNYSYVKTDTLRETIIVVMGILLFITLYVLFLQKWKMKKYNFIVYVIITFCFMIIIYFITKYMLSNIYLSMFTAQLGGLVGASISNNKYKGRLIITGILVTFMVTLMFTKYEKYFVSNNKVEKVCIQFAEYNGYDITDNDYINIFGSSTRNEPIRVFIVRREPNGDWTAVRSLEMVYFKGEIIEFNRRK